ncbi:DUF4231 domain-containing protein [Ligilactobacillus sp. WILCCON 0076]|uniref:DUF4231 domain-containing protein n=1 Tax=Ligilactobacillus ubinensis TaxID=2876789 RepID=A0A9X2FLQ3_9LACO|nr:DUF4231 domain-containing protein [Ligilactobacillus ubinensis]MCP0887974.1 DUF4231 domain-containing protein [Ligilactobacillus ubinensis]
MNNQNIEEYLKKVILKLTKKVKLYSICIHSANIIKLILSAAIPIIISLSEKNVNLLLLVSILSALITIIQGTTSVLGLEDKRHRLLTIIMQLSKESFLYNTQTDPYNKNEKENYHLLIKNIENGLEEVIADQNGN